MSLFDATFLRKLDNLSLITRRAMVGQLQGERRSPRRGASVEFADFRAYAPGDDIRQIDWNLYARMERVFLKLYVAEEELTLHLLLDVSASMDWGEPNKLDYARKVAGGLGYLTLSTLDRVGVTAFGARRQLPPLRGKRSGMALFDFLTKLPVGGASDLPQLCQRYARTARIGGPLFLISDLLDPGWKDAIAALTTRPFEITVVHTLAPQEITPELTGDLRLLDAEGGEPIEITADFETLRQYREHLVSWRAEVEAFCSGRGIGYLFADTGVPVETFLLDHLRRRSVVG